MIVQIILKMPEPGNLRCANTPGVPWPVTLLHSLRVVQVRTGLQ